MKDKLIRTLICGGQISLMAASTTALCDKVRRIHDCSPVAAAALGRCLTASVLMGASLKGKRDKLSLIVDGSGPAGKIICTVTTDGIIKGYIQNPAAELPPRADGKLDVGGIVGGGKLTVVRDERQPEPYVGMSRLVSGEIAEDIAAYYALSEQKPTAVVLGVLCTSSGVSAAGGLFVTPLPGCDEEALCRAEKVLGELEGISTLIKRYDTLEALVEDKFASLSVQVLDKKDIEYKCDCSRERMERALLSLGRNELESIASQQDTVEMSCQFCNSRYVFDSGEILEAIKSTDADHKESGESTNRNIVCSGENDE